MTQASDETVPPPGWVDVVKRYRLWAAVPADERVTEREIHAKHDRYRGNPYYVEGCIADCDRLKNPSCEIAVQATYYRRKWMPCGRPSSDGSGRCPEHGGTKKTPSKRKGALAQLRSENEHLRAELASLRALSDET